MRRFLISVVSAVILGWVLLPLAAFPSTVGMKALRKSHSKENKTLKQQQRSMRNVMKQHGQSNDSRQRFKQNMKMQRQIEKMNQRQEALRLKQQGK